MSTISRRGFVKGVALTPLALTAMAQQGPSLRSSNQFDFVIAGAGHNSLLCAAYLAKAGFSVVVLEGRAMIGGGAKTAEVL
ncbi:MAG: NAD(P)-binding protein, partial [Gammaproteobacteria bacterium]